jgi:serine/threonine-protein phosphatase 2A regulatory subunit B''
LIVFPDDVHETLLHSRWMYTFDRMETFMNKFFGEPAGSKAAAGSRQVYDRYDRYDRYDGYDRYDRYDGYDRYDRYDGYDRYDRYGAR